MKLQQRIKDIFFALIAILSLGFAVFTVQNQASVSMVTSNSMEPTMTSGDFVISKQFDRSKIRNGDVLILPLPQNSSFKYMHRVIEVKASDGGTILRTKGDSNPKSDGWLIEVTSPKVPKVISVINSSYLLGNSMGREFVLTILIGGSALLLLLALLRLLRRSRNSGDLSDTYSGM